MKKKLLIAAAALGGLLVMGLIALSLSLGSLIRRAAVELGPKLTRGPVSLAEVSLSPLAGRAALKGLVIGNPTGYHTPFAFKLERLSVRVKPSSLLSGPIIVRSIEADGPEINYEGVGKKSNLSQLADNVQSFAPAAAPAKGAPAKAAPASTGRKVIIDDFRLSGAKARVAASFLPTDGLTVAMPDVHLTGIGRKSGGATAQEAAAEIFASVTGAITAAVKNPAQDLGKQAEKLKSGLQKSLKGLFR